ncbi:hypothetical protein JW890_05805 [candidate division WOR-3 bacterium]|nr:hypothetical protein [candidate division WOR-3 bacterium]
MKTLFSILLCLTFLGAGCSEKPCPEDNPQTTKAPEVNYISFNLSAAEGLSHLKEGDFVLSFSEASVTEGSFSSISLSFSSQLDSADGLIFEMMLPSTSRFSVFVGLCTPSGCVLDFVSPECPFTVTDSEYVGLKTYFDIPLDPVMTLSYTSNGRQIESLSFDIFEIDIDSIVIEETFIKVFKGKMRLKSSSNPDILFEGVFFVKDAEPIQVMVD